jgi:nucleoid-associated protein YgaU
MRTDVKIGIAVGLLVAIVAVLYFVFVPKPAPVGETNKPEAEKVNLVERAPETPASAPSTSGEGEIIIPHPAETATSAPAFGATATSAPAVSSSVLPTENVAPESVEPLKPAGEERVYVVKAGDAGFWAIAQEQYGDGKYWTLIKNANPGVESNALKAGMKLKLPALATADGGSAAAGTARSIPETPAGSRTYTVAAGDSGFWGIAQKEYGDGKYWTLIAEANPKVESSALRVGQKLVIPPLKDSTAVPSTSASQSRPTKSSASPAKHTSGSGSSGSSGGSRRPIFE